MASLQTLMISVVLCSFMLRDDGSHSTIVMVSGARQVITVAVRLRDIVRHATMVMVMCQTNVITQITIGRKSRPHSLGRAIRNNCQGYTKKDHRQAGLSWSKLSSNWGWILCFALPQNQVLKNTFSDKMIILFSVLAVKY